MVINEEVLQNVEELFSEYGVNYEEIRSYSGRGMFGRYCLGITVKSDNLYQFFLDLGSAINQIDHDREDGLDKIFSSETMTNIIRHLCRASNVRLDNMGLDYIVYWPSIKIEN